MMITRDSVTLRYQLLFHVVAECLVLSSLWWPRRCEFFHVWTHLKGANVILKAHLVYILSVTTYDY